MIKPNTILKHSFVFLKAPALPTVEGKHQELKYITPDIVSLHKLTFSMHISNARACKNEQLYELLVVYSKYVLLHLSLFSNIRFCIIRWLKQ